MKRAQPEADLETAYIRAMAGDDEVLWIRRQVTLLGGRMRLDVLVSAKDEQGNYYQVIEFKAKPANRRAFDQAFLYSVALRLEWALDESVPIRMAVVAPGITDRKLLTDFPSVVFHDVDWKWR